MPHLSLPHFTVTVIAIRFLVYEIRFARMNAMRNKMRRMSTAWMNYQRLIDRKSRIRLPAVKVRYDAVSGKSSSINNAFGSPPIPKSTVVYDFIYSWLLTTTIPMPDSQTPDSALPSPQIVPVPTRSAPTAPRKNVTGLLVNRQSAQGSTPIPPSLQAKMAAVRLPYTLFYACSLIVSLDGKQKLSISSRRYNGCLTPCKHRT
jgi:hypothetical protein